MTFAPKLQYIEHISKKPASGLSVYSKELNGMIYKNAPAHYIMHLLSNPLYSLQRMYRKYVNPNTIHDLFQGQVVSIPFMLKNNGILNRFYPQGNQQPRGQFTDIMNADPNYLFTNALRLIYYYQKIIYAKVVFRQDANADQRFVQFKQHIINIYFAFILTIQTSDNEFLHRILSQEIEGLLNQTLRNCFNSQLYEKSFQRQQSEAEQFRISASDQLLTQKYPNSKISQNETISNLNHCSQQLSSTINVIQRDYPDIELAIIQQLNFCVDLDSPELYYDIYLKDIKSPDYLQKLIAVLKETENYSKTFKKNFDIFQEIIRCSDAILFVSASIVAQFVLVEALLTTCYENKVSTSITREQFYRDSNHFRDFSVLREILFYEVVYGEDDDNLFVHLYCEKAMNGLMPMDGVKFSFDGYMHFLRALFNVWVPLSHLLQSD